MCSVCSWGPGTVLAAVFALALRLTADVPAMAATFTVNSTADAVDEGPGRGKCQDNPSITCTTDADCTNAGLMGPCNLCDTGRAVPPAATTPECTLRAAIQEANATAGADTISVPAGTYTLTIAGGGEDGGANGDLDITHDLTLNGAGAEATIISGVADDRVFHVDPNGGNSNVSMSGVTVQNGSATHIAFVEATGGGILIGSTATAGDPTIPSGTLTLSDCVIQGNSSEGRGGGLANKSGTLVIIRSRVSDNAGNSGGGGIISRLIGKTTLIDSTVSNNSSDAGGGGGIQIYGGETTVSNSTISGNTATSQGGGIARYYGTLTMANSTVSGNTAGDGGGIYNHYIDNGPNILNNCTIANNHAHGSGLGVSGGISNLGPFTLKNTIAAGNTRTSSDALIGSDCTANNAAFTSAGYNLIQNFPIHNLGTAPECYFTGDLTGNVIGQDPILGPLGDYGGPTRTHILLAGSPAIDAGNPAPPGSGGGACAVTDQRRVFRPRGAACDVGASEDAGDLAIVIAPNRGGNLGLVSVRLTGRGFADGVAVRLRRAGETDIEGVPVTIAGDSTLTTAFDLSSRTPGAWDVVVTNRDITSVALAGGFTIETGGIPDLWVQVIGPAVVRRNGPARFYVRYGNRGTVDAFGVPLGLSFSGSLTQTLHFPILPPPSLPEQIPGIDWNRQPMDVTPDLAAGGAMSIPLVLGVVPAGSSGTLEITIPFAGDFDDDFLLAAIDRPYFTPSQEVDPLVVDAFVQGVRRYAEAGVPAVVPLLGAVEADLALYVRDQLAKLVADSRVAAVAGFGAPQVYSLAQLTADQALFAFAHAFEGSVSIGARLRTAPAWIAAFYARGRSLLGRFIPAAALAQATGPRPTVPCVIYDRQPGGICPAGCMCPSPDRVGPPPTEGFPEKCPPKSAADLKTLVTDPDCRSLPKETCEAMLGYKVITGTDGEKYCVPEKCKNPSPFSNDPKCRWYPIKKSTSHDPNDKLGFPGIGTARFVPGENDLGYIVRFENLATATAAAQVVEITDQLDTNALDLGSFSLGPIAFGDITVTLPDGEAQYAAGVDLRPAKNLIVLINAGLDAATGIATWRLTSLDPVTLNLTEDAAAGFLPPNVTPPAGEGSVQFNVKPKPGLTTGTQSCNQATIVFDDNAPIDTPPWCNTIDNSPPQSHVLLLPATQFDPDVRLQWDGSDQGAGIATYTVYVAANGGAFAPLVSDTTDTAATFTGRVGESYAFCSIATDLVGNVEPKPCPPHADTSIAIGPPPTPTPPPACVGDCDGDGAVTVDELVRGVNIALGNLPLDSCPSFDVSHDDAVTVDELVRAVGAALNGCARV